MKTLIWKENDKDTAQATFDPQTGEYKGLSDNFLGNLKDLNERRDKYLKTGKYEEFLQVEYGLGPNSRRIKNARDFHIVLSPNSELGNKMRPIYLDEIGYQFMEQVFSTRRGGSVQTRITLFTFLQTQPAIDYVYLLEWYGYLDED
ncbi:MAG: hypothetical protein ACOC1X_04065 [Promethearchaeota archaeon]